MAWANAKVVAASADDIAWHVDNAREHLEEAYGALADLVGHPDGPAVACALHALGHTEGRFASLLLLAGDVRAKADHLIGEAY